jgi:hypothetical protein
MYLTGVIEHDEWAAGGRYLSPGVLTRARTQASPAGSATPELAELEAAA